VLCQETPPTSATLDRRTQAAITWIVEWQKTNPRALWAAIEANHLTFYPAMNHTWLAQVIWDSDNIIVIEQTEGSLSRFNEMTAALTFLNALLMHRIIKDAEFGGETTQQPMPSAATLFG
jgi:hypothetical protein